MERLVPTAAIGRSLILVTLVILLLPLWARSVSDAPIVSHAQENVWMGVNLAHHGVLSGTATAPVRPTMYREPLPAVVTAIGVLILDGFKGAADVDAYLGGSRAKFLKYQNVGWAALMTAAVMGLLMLLTGSFSLAMAGAVAANLDLPFLPSAYLDTLYSEPAASALVATTSLSLAWWGRQRSRNGGGHGRPLVCTTDVDQGHIPLRLCRVPARSAPRSCLLLARSQRPHL